MRSQTILADRPLREEPREKRIRRLVPFKNLSLAPLIERMAPAHTQDVPVSLNAETGSGKTFPESVIHDHSPRKDHPLSVVACAADAGQPPDLRLRYFRAKSRL
ncbi:MAG TPA: sigma 54-interacting transcriptional regulator [Gemmataceae bacterium]|nr:sigma 54-interacting transcriptional regulator [Gemmataceae bacterium]